LLTSIVAAAFILALLIIVHEAGHFVVAKRLGVRVLRFSIGYPPKVWGIRRGETEYAIGATPFGGYVRMLGEEVGEEPRSDEMRNYVREIALDVLEAAHLHGWNGHSKDNDAEIVALARALNGGSAGASQVQGGEMAVVRPVPASQANATGLIGRELTAEESVVFEEIAAANSLEQAQKEIADRSSGPVLRSFQGRAFPTQALWKRFMIVLAGPASNILFAPILMTIVFLYGVPMLLPLVGEVQPNMPAYAAGLRKGDRILAVDSKPVDSWSDFSLAVKSSDGAPLKIDIQRDSARQSMVIRPERKDEQTIYGNKIPTWIIGVMPEKKFVTRRYGPISAVGHGVTATVDMAGTLMVGIWQILNGSTPVRQALGGPIMIAQMAGQEAREGFPDFMMFTVMLSLELGIINLLPVPLLDGGHLLFFACEGVRGKPLQLRTREVALQVGLFLLVALMAFVIFNDISRIVQG
jgi:regulator of sigma E protease